MQVPVFAQAFGDSGVRSMLGGSGTHDPLRLYPFGLAPQGVQKPYAVFQTISGSPENYLSCRPDEDNFVVQIDVYGVSVASVRAATRVLTQALETIAYITRWGNESVEPETQHYRFDFDVEFIVQREALT
jgi:hypothetical protein